MGDPQNRSSDKSLASALQHARAVRGALMGFQFEEPETLRPMPLKLLEDHLSVALREVTEIHRKARSARAKQMLGKEGAS